MRFWILLLLLASGLSSAFASDPRLPLARRGRQPLQQYVMMPLAPITDWAAFRRGLRSLKALGVLGVTTDICWGLVEKSEGEFDWSYYKELGRVLGEEKMAWVTILSTHAIGGNVGDDVNIPIPEYVWNRVPGAEYRYRAGQSNRETISFFANDEATTEVLERFYASFKREIFDPYADNIAKIYVGLGPASEARYPSYAAAIDYRYPGEGEFPIYAPEAIASFRSYLRERYKTIGDLNFAWGLDLKSFDEATVPQETTAWFLEHARHTLYFRDLMNWYTQTLVRGIHRGLKATSKAFRGDVHGPLGKLFSIKVAGIHWQRLNPTIPRGPELAAGYENYDPIFFAAREWGVGVTFTCLEMEKVDAGYPRYSDPPGMVAQVVDAACRMGVPISGENALEFGHAEPLHTVRRLVESLDADNSFHAFTFLRWHQLVHADGSPTKFAGSYRDVLVKPSRMRIEYVSTKPQAELDGMGLDLFAVPVNPSDLSWEWERGMPLRARDPNSRLLFGSWDAFDPQAQYLAIGALDRATGAHVQLTFPQPVENVERPMGKLILGGLWPFPADPPTLDPDSRLGAPAEFKRALANCADLLSPLMTADGAREFAEHWRRRVDLAQRFESQLLERIRRTGRDKDVDGR